MTVAAALVVIAGFLVGATTLGGLIVVPALTEFARVDIDRAVAAASAAMIAPALLATAAAWADTTQRAAAIAVTVGSGGGAAAGAASLAVIPASLTIMLLAALALVGGVRGLLGDRLRPHGPHHSSTAVVALVAIVAGALSAITGTGGPIALWPLLMLFGQPLAVCWIGAHAIQLPVAIGATAANALAGRLDVTLAAGLAALLAIGFVIGRRVAARRSVDWLGRAASVLLIAIAGWLWWALVHARP